MKQTRTSLGVCLLSLCALSACSNSGRYHIKNDRAPDTAPDVTHVENAHPKYEPYSRGGNRNYKVLGKSYKVMDTGANFTETGLASWYGSKFHGHKTSNGETYDMYSMSAAHKNLPLPSYAKVTNLDNQKQVIVRINDRGPFHGNRILDLSYSAAHRLDMLKTGTAKIKLEVIHFESPSSPIIKEAKSRTKAQYYLQVLASSNKQKLKAISDELTKKYTLTNSIVPHKTLFRLQLGPIAQKQIANSYLEKLKLDGFSHSFIIRTNTK